MEQKKDIVSSNNDFKGQLSQNDIESSQYANINKVFDSNSMLKRTLKIATALYMVTESIESSEPIKKLLRTSVLSIVNKVGNLNQINAIKTQILFEEIETDILHILGLVELAHTVGIIGSMNGSILMKEFTLLSTVLEAYKKENKEGKFNTIRFRSQTLESFVFPQDTEDREIGNKGQNLGFGNSEGNSKGHEQLLRNFMSFNKGHEMETVGQSSFKGHNVNDKGQLKNYNGHSKKVELALKNERRNTIFKLLKDKKEIMIKDITSVIHNCSEKTLQRELFSLVTEGVLKKKGEKRWSRYTFA